MLFSRFAPLVPVDLPYKGRQNYMHEIDARNPVMLKGFEDYFDPVMALLRAAGLNKGQAFMTVDEKLVMPGFSQRRPGPHVDGHFAKELGRWNHGPGWNHYCNEVPIPRMHVIVAASVVGCLAWEGDFDTEPKNDGDLSHIEDELGIGTYLEANMGFLLSPDCIHESTIFQQSVERSFLRIAFL